jgi:hypothetical protein
MSNNIVTSVSALTDTSIDNNSDTGLVCIDIENGFIGVNNSTPNTHVDVNGVIKCYKLWIGTTPFTGSD